MPWTTDIQLCDDTIEFKIYPGASITMIPTTVYRESRDDKLQSIGKVLHGLSQYTLTVLGKFHGAL